MAKIGVPKTASVSYRSFYSRPNTLRKATASMQELEGICFANVSVPGGQGAQIHAVLLENRNVALDNIFFKSFASARPAIVYLSPNRRVQVAPRLERATPSWGSKSSPLLDTLATSNGLEAPKWGAEVPSLLRQSGAHRGGCGSPLLLSARRVGGVRSRRHSRHGREMTEDG